MTSPPIVVVDLGRRGYAETLELQRRLCRARIDGDNPDDLLLLVEHPPVITLGRGARETSLPIPATALASRGIEVHEVERGGDVTLHAPGQLVGYPILDLHRFRLDLHWYLRQLEQLLMEALTKFDVVGDRVEGLTGVWVGNRKIASIGVHVKRWVTFHGFALNLSTDLTLFDLIVPCGIPNVVMTSVLAERPGLNVETLRPAAVRAVTGAASRVFDRPVRHAAPDALPSLAELAPEVGRAPT